MYYTELPLFVILKQSCSNFVETEFINYECFHMRSEDSADVGAIGWALEPLDGLWSHEPGRGTSLIRNCFLPERYSRTLPRALWWP